MNVYLLPFAKQWIIYHPLRCLAFAGNKALADYVRNRSNSSQRADTDVEQFLTAVGFDGPPLECPAFDIPDNGPAPVGAVLLMTNKCNLRCVYCYANAGSESKTVEMTWPTAKSVIDYVIANAALAHSSQSSDADPPSITFHGGGEPTVHWDLMVRCVKYARERDVRTRFSMSSNGVWNASQRRFICRHFHNVSLSMDGVPSVQNAQRPARNGGESFAAVMESIREMDSAGVEYGIRMTVMEDSVELVPEGVRFICENTRTHTIQIEPTFTSSRGRYADIAMHFADAFADRFMEAWEIGRLAGRQVYYSGARPWVVAPLFCQAPLKAAVATADGRLVSCFEVFSEQSPLADGFTVGRVTDGAVKYDRQALQAFLDAQQRRREECEDCFCYWHCCGDCATRRPGKRSDSEGRCRVTRKITLALLQNYMADGGGLWRGLHEMFGGLYHDTGCVQARFLAGSATRSPEFK
jgi:uncharacterized protein